jgi:hypothetical protein
MAEEGLVRHHPQRDPDLRKDRAWGLQFRWARAVLMCSIAMLDDEAAGNLQAEITSRTRHVKSPGDKTRVRRGLCMPNSAYL